MFARIFTVVVASLSLLAVSAAPAPGFSSRDVSQCNAGSVQCCNQVQDASTVSVDSFTGHLIKSLLNVQVDTLTGLVGLDCSPIGALGGSSCSTQQVCCQDNQFNALVSVGCSPINAFV